jgi:ribosomal protein S18 acetylase RimI-like enzyme
VATLTQVQIRPLAEDEVAVVERAVRRAPGKHRERLARQARDEGLYLFAWLGSEPVGHAFLLWANSRVGVGTAALEDLGVEPEWRRQHIGTDLMARCESESRGRGLEQIAFSVGVDNGPAREFYLRLGYAEKEGELPHTLRYRTIDAAGAPRTAEEVCTTFAKRLVRA